MGLIASPPSILLVTTMDKTQQVVSVMAVCASILLVGMIIAYKPGMVAEFRFPTGVSSGLGTATYTNVSAEPSSTPKTMSISGTGTVYVKTDQATVTLGVYTEGKLASAAIEENAALMTAVINALKDLKFTEEDIKTTGYSVSTAYNWEIQSVVGYQVTNMIQIKIKDLTKVGPAIDAVTAAGANRVDSISFGISDETAQTMKLAAYTAAINDAKAKSEIICDGLDVSITGVQSISESYYYPYSAYRSYDAGASSEGKASTPIVSGNLSITATLNIVYLIE